MSQFRTPGAPSVIPSNVVGGGLVRGDQLGDALPGVLASLQESPEASKTSSLYYPETVGKFLQPSFQRSFGSLNLPVNISKFGDSGSVEINPDIYWKGPFMLSTTFTIPYAYYGPVASRSNVAADNPNFPPNTLNYVGSSNTNYFEMNAGMGTMRPRMFYSWGAAYANLRQIRLNMGGAFSYVLDHYSNWIAIMASCISMKQRALLMKMAGGGTMIADDINETMYGLNYDTAETGGIPLCSADGALLTAAAANTARITYGQGPNAQIGPSALPGPVIEHWICCIKTPHTNFDSIHQFRRPIDTRLFSTNFVVDFFTSNALDTFMDTGMGFQPVLGCYPQATSETILAPFLGLQIPAGSGYALWRPTDGLFPSMLYRQLFIPNATTLTALTTGSMGNFTVTAGTQSNWSSMRFQDVTLSMGGNAYSTTQSFRSGQQFSYRTAVQSAGYTSGTYGANPSVSGPVNYLTPDNMPAPAYNTIINSLRLANDQLGAAEVLKTRADLCVYYPFQHFTSQIYRINQLTDATGNTPYNANTTFNQATPYANSVTGGQGYGGMTLGNLENYNQAPTSYQIPLSVAISIPNNPLTVLYIAVMREKDRIGLGWSTMGQYSPVLYWNCLELQSFSLTYSAQVLQKFGSMSEYYCQQIHERPEALVVPWRGGPIVRRDLPLQNPQLIQDNFGYPGAWYNSYIYEFCMVDRLPLRNESDFQQTPGFRGEMINFNFTLKPTLKPYAPSDFDFRSVTLIDNSLMNGASPPTPTQAAQYYTYLERLAQWCPGIPQTAVADNPGITWNLNNDNLMVVCVFAQNALWQLNPLACKVVFARGA